MIIIYINFFSKNKNNKKYTFMLLTPLSPSLIFYNIQLKKCTKISTKNLSSFYIYIFRRGLIWHSFLLD